METSCKRENTERTGDQEGDEGDFIEGSAMGVLGAASLEVKRSIRVSLLEVKRRQRNSPNPAGAG
jgi:hypothetical protein